MYLQIHLEYHLLSAIHLNESVYWEDEMLSDGIAPFIQCDGDARRVHVYGDSLTSRLQPKKQLSNN